MMNIDRNHGCHSVNREQFVKKIHNGGKILRLDQESSRISYKIKNKNKTVCQNKKWSVL